jgi:hypothetical protein
VYDILPRHVAGKGILRGHFLLPSFTLSLLSFSAFVALFCCHFAVLPASEIHIPKSTDQKASKFCRHSTNKAIAYENLSSIDIESKSFRLVMTFIERSRWILASDICLETLPAVRGWRSHHLLGLQIGMYFEHVKHFTFGLLSRSNLGRLDHKYCGVLPSTVRWRCHISFTFFAP